jgi:two-component system sensor histidine kinase/response regulator
LRRRNGAAMAKNLPMEVSLYYQAGGDLMPPQLIAFQTDITQRKSAEQALIEAKQQAENANDRNLLLVQELERANRRLQLNDQRLSATFALSQEAPMLDEAQILQRGIDEAVRLTGSEMGYVHLVDESQVALERQVWSYGTNGQALATPAAQPAAITPAGKWADPLRTGKAVVHNEYPSLPDTRHSPLPTDSWQRHLGVPVRDGSKIRLLAGVCNKAADYHESDQHNLQDIANDLWSILQRRRTEIELANAKKSAETATVAKSAFLANMSHEIRTPLNAITGMTHLIRRSGVTAEQSERLGKIEMAGSHLLEIINAILDLSKIEAGKFTLEEVSLDVAGIVANVVSILNHQAGAKKLEIVVDNQLPMNNFVGDPTRLQQGLLNFGSNAIKFSDKGRVTIRVQIA